jgi:hypothetical protein
LTGTYGTLVILLVSGALWQLQHVRTDGTALGKTCCFFKSSRAQELECGDLFPMNESSIFCNSCQPSCIREDEESDYDTGNCGEYGKDHNVSQQITIAASMYVAGILLLGIFPYNDHTRNVLRKYMKIYIFEASAYCGAGTIVFAMFITFVCTIVTMSRAGAWSKSDTFPATKEVDNPSDDPDDPSTIKKNVEICDREAYVAYYNETPNGPPSLLLNLTIAAIGIMFLIHNVFCNDCKYEEDESQSGNRSRGPDAEEDCKKKDDDGVAELLESANRSQGPDAEEDRNANSIQLELGNMKE